MGFIVLLELLSHVEEEYHSQSILLLEADELSD
jgi:hypothetical protein